jgi:phage terminase small subunit
VAAYGAGEYMKGGYIMLTANQEKFCQGIIEGKSQAEAYREAYPKQRSSDKTVWEAASRLMANSKVNARIAELRDQLAKPTIMSAQERLEWLTKVINGEIGEKVLQVVDGEEVEIEVPTSLKNKISAMDTMNKMTGEYTQKIEANVSNDVNIKIELSDD